MAIPDIYKQRYPASYVTAMPVTPDLKQCQGETLTTTRPNHVGPPPSAYRCRSRPTWLASVEVGHPSTRLSLSSMSLCEWCMRTLVKNCWEVINLTQLPMGDAKQAAYALGGMDAVWDLSEWVAGPRGHRRPNRRIRRRR